MKSEIYWAWPQLPQVTPHQNKETKEKRQQNELVTMAWQDVGELTHLEFGSSFTGVKRD